MNGGIIPFVLAAITTGLMLGLAELRAGLRALAAFIAAAFIEWFLPVLAPETTLFAALFAAILAVGIAVYVRAARSPLWLLVLAFNGGLWLGACAAASRSPAGLAMIALTPIAAAGARWTARRDATIIVKVAASWMMAIASLTLFVSLIPTPGYQPDHME